MYATERRELIDRALAHGGRVSVADLAERFGVTTETVRRDLASMAEDGLLRRVHGGAVPAGAGSLAEPALGDKAARNPDAKRAIAEAAIGLIPAGFSGSIYLDAGTTTAALADSLPTRIDLRRSEVVTHAAAIAALLSERGADVYAVGGRVRRLTGAAVGSRTVQTIESLRPDIAFLGANAIAAGFGLSTPDPDEADVKRAIVGAARRVVLLTDASKFGEESLQRFARLEDLDVAVVDRAPVGALADELASADVEVVTAGRPEDGGAQA
ncbi:DeoR/GlpR family DNA-binding transcription regulator [Microbacterium halophytorum]|uniref:DeoR/GlpR family DNA-binding transcription regulator n=1 Tax=Microbacterium halophytorum TaxID=2067568 RepID=UPI000CFD0AE8|nr:DeoR/GlpR family DNA-binding transcription regulator [Microbacterium halophytorum]